MNERKLRLRIGMFVVAALAALVAMVWFFGGLPRIYYTPVTRYTVLLNNAAGLGPGAPVRRSGVKIGQVSRVELEDDTDEVRVEIEIYKPYTIHRNEEPVLRRTVLGDTSLDFVPAPTPPTTERMPEPGLLPRGDATGRAYIGELSAAEEATVHVVAQAQPRQPAQPDRSAVPPGSTIKGTVQPDIQASLSDLQKAAETFNRLAPKLDRTITEAGVAVGNWGRVGERVEAMMRGGLEDNIMKTAENANKTLERLAPFLSDENQRNAATAIKNVRKASEGWEGLTKDTDQFVRESQITLKDITTTVNQMNSVAQDIAKVTRPLGTRGEEVAKNLDESLARLNRLLADFQDLMSGKSGGTLGLLLNDPALYQNLNDAACGIARLIPMLHNILKDAEVFADKIARHPESLGVGGAIRPSSGIK